MAEAKRPGRSPWRDLEALVAVAALLSLLAAPLAAEEPRSLAVSIGSFDVSKDRSQVEGGLEYRQPIGVWQLCFAGGVFGTEEGSVWGFAGLRRDLPLGGRFLLTPAFGIALYEEGDGKDLGGLVEFRSAIELGREFADRSRIALVFYHLSNAGLYDLNPGSNSLILTYSFPLQRP